MPSIHSSEQYRMPMVFFFGFLSFEYGADFRQFGILRMSMNFCWLWIVYDVEFTRRRIDLSTQHFDGTICVMRNSILHSISLRFFFCCFFFTFAMRDRRLERRRERKRFVVALSYYEIQYNLVNETILMRKQQKISANAPLNIHVCVYRRYRFSQFKYGECRLNESHSTWYSREPTHTHTHT